MKEYKFIVVGITPKQADLLQDMIMLFINAAGLYGKAICVLRLPKKGAAKHGKA